MTAWNPGGSPPDPNEEPTGQMPPEPPPYAQPPSYGPPSGPPQYGPPQYGPPQYGPQYGQQPPAYGQFGPPPAFGAPVPGPSGTRPLNMGNRVLAYIIDLVIVGVPFGIIYGIAAAALVTGAHFNSDGQYVAASGGGSLLFIQFILLLAGLAYFIYFIGKTGQTIGKRVMGVQVVDSGNGQPIGYGRAAIRYIVQGVCNFLCFAGLWSAFLDSSSGRYQGWHDKAANDLVISVK